jgi:cytochrome c-type biogenesis protein CcmH
MISLALILAAITLLVLAALLWPLLRPRPLDVGRRAHTLAVHRDQLMEIERDLQRQLLSEAQAEAARTEIHRRILAAERVDAAPATTASTGARLTAVAVVSAGVPVLSILIYLTLGAPLTPAGAPIGAAPSAAVADPAIPHEVAQMVERLAERLKKEPNDAEGWAMLARSYSMMGRHAEAAEAHGRLAALRNNDPAIIAVQAEELIVAAQGTVTPEALSLLMKAQAGDPSDPRLRFYLGLAQAQIGDVAGAQRIWLELEISRPAGGETRGNSGVAWAADHAAASGPTAGLRSCPPRVAAARALRG